MERKRTLLLCSYGLRPGQITLETLALLKSCDAVFSNSLDRFSAEKLRPYCGELRLVKGARWEPLAKKIFAAFSKKNKIAFLTYGNPFFLNPPACLLAEEAARRGIAFEVAEGVSSFDGIINQLRLGQFAEEGLRLVNLGDGSEAARGRAPAMDTLFFSLWTLEAGKPGLKKKFLSGLASAYPPEHPVLVIDHPGSVRTTIGQLGAALGKAALTTTLFVPAAAPAVKLPGRKS
jgi:hypothetical protein